MMLHVQCPGCLEEVFIDCACPGGHVADTGWHHPGCPLRNIDMSLECDCCPAAHDHGEAARACPGGHEQENCPEEKGECRLWDGEMANVLHPSYSGGHPLLHEGHRAGDEVPPCPGGHCHPDTPGCTVCRPLIITVEPGTRIMMVLAED